MKNDLITVNIYGQQYTLKTDGTEDYINKVAEYLFLPLGLHSIT